MGEWFNVFPLNLTSFPKISAIRRFQTEKEKPYETLNEWCQSHTYTGYILNDFSSHSGRYYIRVSSTRGKGGGNQAHVFKLQHSNLTGCTSRAWISSYFVCIWCYLAPASGVRCRSSADPSGYQLVSCESMFRGYPEVTGSLCISLLCSMSEKSIAAIIWSSNLTHDDQCGSPGSHLTLLGFLSTEEPQRGFIVENSPPHASVCDRRIKKSAFVLILL